MVDEKLLGSVTTEVDETELDEKYQAIMERMREENGGEDPFKEEAMRRARKILRKHRFELRRLEKHAQKCLLELNKEGYIYAIGKIRTIIRQPLSREQLEELYESSVNTVLSIFKEMMMKETQKTTDQ